MTVPIPAGRFLLLHMLPVFQDVSALPYLLQTVNCIFPSYADVLGTAPYSVRRNKDSSSPVSVFLSHHPYRLRAMDSTGRYWSDKKENADCFFHSKCPESFVHIHRIPIHNAKYYILLQEISCKILHLDCSAHIKSGLLFYNPSVDLFFVY